MVHRRELNGETLVFGNHGALWGNAMTWWDTETGSVWSQPIGEAILGPLKGERLELLPSQVTNWREWREQHPETLALDAPGGRDRFSLASMAIVVALGDDSAAFPVSDLERSSVVNTTVNQVPIAVVLVPGEAKWKVFSRQLNDRVIELDLASDGTLRSRDGAASFDPATGIALDGGQNLDQLPGFTSFPRDYATFYPQGRFVTADGEVLVENSG